MKKEVIVTAKTVAEAVSKGADELGVDESKVTSEVLEAPKKGFLGFGEAPAKVKVIFETTPEFTALEFVNKVIADMEIDAAAEFTETNDDTRDYLINISGPDAGQLIGHHGETLDSLQYLANLAANKREEDGSRNYTRIAIDIEGYREKRAETLRELARRMAGKVLKYKKSMTLEPMNSYERRIIHSEIQNIEGVSTNSIGSEDNRRVVIFLTGSEGEKHTKKPYGHHSHYGKKAPLSEMTEEEADLAAENADYYEDETVSSVGNNE